MTLVPFKYLSICFIVILGSGDLSKNTGGEVGQVHQTAGERRLHESTN